MNDDNKIERAGEPWPELQRLVRERTPARLMEGRVGASYRTATELQLRADHAAARDAVQDELELGSHLGPEFVARWGIFEVQTMAQSKAEYLLRPELGRRLDEAARRTLAERCPKGRQLQVAIGDGLSVRAVAAQVPSLLPLLLDGADSLGWSVGQPFAIRHCRVGVLNELGELLDAAVVVLLVGERPGLATAESLSAYLAYRPRSGHTDAERNLVSNIHANGVPPAEAAPRILRLVARMLSERTSGIALKEEMPAKRLAE